MVGFSPFIQVDNISEVVEFLVLFCTVCVAYSKENVDKKLLKLPQKSLILLSMKKSAKSAMLRGLNTARDTFNRMGVGRSQSNAGRK